MIVCHCRAITDRAIREAVRSGAVDLDAVEAATGAGSCCGGCQPTVEAVIGAASGDSNAALAVRPGMRPLRVLSSSDRAA
jgi:bacterioferritin-associated ferredoxin